MKPTNLYHFTKASTAIQYILPSMSIRMGALGDTNDPKENLLHITENLDYYIDNRTIDFDYQDIEYATKIRKEVFIAAFSTDRKIKTGTNTHTSRGYELQRMWAQYGDNHTGICIIINYESFLKENAKIIKEFNIKYDNILYDNYLHQSLPRQDYGTAVNCVHESLSDSDYWKELQNNELFIKGRFFTKDKDWENESEYRFLAFNKESDELLLSFKDSLDKIVTGINFSKHYYPSLNSLELSTKTSGLTLCDLNNKLELVDFRKFY